MQLWDLREPSSSHAHVELPTGRQAVRAPTYCSDSLVGSAHATPITTLAALPSPADSDDLSIASLEVDGSCVIWLVIETAPNDAAADFGQAVGGRLRLLKSVTVPVVGGGAAAARKKGKGGKGGGGAMLPVRALSLACLPDDATRFLIGTDEGAVLQKSRYAGNAPSPAVFGGAAGGGGASEVTSLAFCPAAPSYFAAARSDGSLALYAVDERAPLLAWPGVGRAALVQLRWSAARPAVLWALDADAHGARPRRASNTRARQRPAPSSHSSHPASPPATVHVYDLLESAHAAAHAVPLAPGGGAGAARLGAKAGALGGLRFDISVPRGRGAGGVRLAVGAPGEPGVLHVHHVTEKLSRAQPDELERLLALLDEYS